MCMAENIINCMNERVKNRFTEWFFKRLNNQRYSLSKIQSFVHMAIQQYNYSAGLLFKRSNGQPVIQPMCRTADFTAIYPASCASTQSKILSAISITH